MEAALFTRAKDFRTENEKAAIAGSVSGALHVHQLAELYGVPVILHTDHAAKKLLPWIDGLLDAGETFYAATWQTAVQLTYARLVGRTTEENLEICARYLERMSKIGMTLKLNWVSPAVKKMVLIIRMWTVQNYIRSQKKLLKHMRYFQK